MDTEDRFERLEHTVLDMSGRLTAFEFAIRVLIANHPEPEKIYGRWSKAIPELVDEMMSNPAYQMHPIQQEGMHHELGRLSLEVQKLRNTDTP